MTRGNVFAETISAIFAIFIFIVIGGVLVQSLGQQTQIFGDLTFIFVILLLLIFMAIIFKLVKSIIDIF